MSKQGATRPRPRKETEAETEDRTEVEEGYATVDDLLNQTPAGEDFPVPGVGKVKIRGMSRDAAHRVANEEDSRKRELIMVRDAMIQPSMSYAQVEAWFRVPAVAGIIQDLTLRITYLSGLDEDAEAEDVERFRDESE